MLSSHDELDKNFPRQAHFVQKIDNISIIGQIFDFGAHSLALEQLQHILAKSIDRHALLYFTRRFWGMAYSLDVDYVNHITLKV